MVKQTISSGDKYVLLKCDVIKAFDRVDWSILFAILDKFGLSGILTDFLGTSFVFASSAILSNGIMFAPY